MIQRLVVTIYPEGPGNYSNTQFDFPSWETVERELCSMHPYHKPILSLLTDGENPGADMMQVTGGDGVYHVEIADSECQWHEAVDPNGSDETIDVWTSDQGFSTYKKYTWSFDDVNEIVRFYFENGKAIPSRKWE